MPSFASNIDSDAYAELVHDDSEAEAASRLTAATLHLMSAYAQCACPKLAVIVETHITELARVAQDACVRAVCASIKSSWMQKDSSCAAPDCFAERFNQSEPPLPCLFKKFAAHAFIKKDDHACPTYHCQKLCNRCDCLAGGLD